MSNDNENNTQLKKDTGIGIGTVGSTVQSQSQAKAQGQGHAPAQQGQGQGQTQAHQPFQVQNTPKGLFPLFHESSDSYIYDKKFYCDLPQVITPPKSFHYPFSIQSFCQFDLLTMVFDLKPHCEILTDPKLNTLIHQDFINNSLELISPNLTQATNINAPQMDQLKRDIIDIAERQEDIPNEKKTAMHNRSFYLRNSTYFRTSLNVKAESSQMTQQAKRKNRTMSDSIPRINTDETKKVIAKTFNDIASLKVGKEHPHRKGITAKNVYEILPYGNLGGCEFNQFIFPIDPSQEVMVNEKFDKPNKFILKRRSNEDNYNDNDNNANDIYALYQNDHLKGFTKPNESKESNELSAAEYYSYDKDYTFTSAHQYELFNRFLMFVNREKKTVKFTSMHNKFTMKKYKKNLPRNRNAIDEEGDEDNINNPDANNANLLRRKRESDVIVIPKEINEANLIKRNQWIKQNGFGVEFEGKEIQDIDYTEVNEIRKEKNIEDMDMMNVEKEDEGRGGTKKNDDEEEEDYFGQGNDDDGDDGDNDEDSFDKRHRHRHKHSDDDNSKSEDSPEHNKEEDAVNEGEGDKLKDDDEDALFSEKNDGDDNDEVIHEDREEEPEVKRKGKLHKARDNNRANLIEDNEQDNE